MYNVGAKCRLVTNVNFEGIGLGTVQRRCPAISCMLIFSVIINLKINITELIYFFNKRYMHQGGSGDNTIPIDLQDIKYQ